MARIRKNGIDYFPMDTDFMNHRVVRRIMKREGDRTLGILVSLFSCIYAGEGYYVVADDTFYDDLSASFYDSTPDDVRRIVEAHGGDIRTEERAGGDSRFVIHLKHKRLWILR